MRKFSKPPDPLPIERPSQASDRKENVVLSKGDGKHNRVRSVVLQLQDFLSAVGYSPHWYGPPEKGEFGESTEKALKAFQESNKDWKGEKLEANGQVDARTADAINRLVVGLRYGSYTTPKQLTKGTVRLTSTLDSLHEQVSIDPTSANNATITIVPEPKPWARQGSKVSNSGMNVEYKEREGNHIRWLQDGGLAMYEMCESFCKAKAFIYVIASYFSPGIKLIRTPSGFRSFARKHPEYKTILEKVSEVNSTLGVNRQCVPLIVLLKVKTELENVPVRIMQFYPDKAQAHFGGYAGYKDAASQVRKIAPHIDLRLSEWGGLRVKGHEFGSQHQKSAVVGLDKKDLVAFCGGVDMCYARWALPSHNLDKDPLDLKENVDKVFRINDQMGTIDTQNVLGEWNPQKKRYDKGDSQVLWHDVHVKMVGPVAFDLAENFRQRYEDAQSSENKSKPFPIKDEIEPYRDQSHVSSDLLSGGFTYSREKVRAQILRSYAPSDDYGIWDGYRNLFASAKRNVYIENQYAFEDSQALDALIENVRSNKNLKVILVSPLRPDSYDSDIMKNVRKLVNSSMGKGDDPAKARVTAYSLVANLGTGSKPRMVPIYCHAKLAVVDDEWAIVGSANLDRMGMGGKGGGWFAYGSSEVCVLVHSRNHGIALRKMLAEEHLGITQPSSRMENFDTIFGEFQDAAESNGRPNSYSRVKGQLVFHRLYHNLSSG